MTRRNASRGAQDEPIRAHRGCGLDQAEEEIGAGEQRPIQQAIGAGTRRCAHDVGGRLLRAEAERGQHFGAEIDGENLDDCERERDAEDDEREVRNQLGDIRAEDVGQEAADVGEDGAAFLAIGHKPKINQAPMIQT